MSSDFGDYEFHKTLWLKHPYSSFIRGFSFESSDYGKDLIYINWFVQPLYVPSDCITYIIGARVVGGNHNSYWHIKTDYLNNASAEILEAMLAEAKPKLEAFISPASVYTYLKANPASIRQTEARAYSAAYAGLPDYETELEVIINELNDPAKRYTDWLNEIYANTKLLLDNAKKGHPFVKSIMDEWIVKTKENLKL